jgi:hypothetical protein
MMTERPFRKKALVRIDQEDFDRIMQGQQTPHDFLGLPQKGTNCKAVYDDKRDIPFIRIWWEGLPHGYDVYEGDYIPEIGLDQLREIVRQHREVKSDV